MEFNEYQKLAKETDQRENTTDEVNRLIPLLGMIGEVGSVASEHKKRMRDKQSYIAFKDKFKKELGDVLWYISALAGDMEITLDDVAQANLAWTKERWDDLNNFLPEKLFDESFPEEEQFPREFTVELRESHNGKIQMLLDGVELGNPLDDNSHNEDGYRFHDIFHLAYLAIIGWSPVLRALMKRKRKSVPAIDNVEDGARATTIEEAISAIVYEQAKDHNFYENITVVDFDILNSIKVMVRNFEVKNISTSLWEKAIIDGYTVFREIRAKNGGKIYLNLKTRTIKILS